MDFLLIAITFGAIAAGALVKGLTGMGLPVLAVPALSYFVGLPHAIGVLIVPVAATNFLQAVQTRAEFRNVPFLWPLLICGMIGIALGTWLLAFLAAQQLNLILALLLFFYIGLRLLRPDFSISIRRALYMSPGIGLAAGAVQGAAGLCAAVFVPYVHAMSLKREAMIFAISMVFLMFAVFQTVSLVAAGLLEGRALLEGVFALVPVAVFMPIGTWLGRRLDKKVFDRAFLVVLAVIALSLLEAAIW